jgi:Tfp pilus assembly PilM family ATPase
MALPFLSSQSKRIDQVVGIDLGARETKAVLLHRKSDRLDFLAYAVQATPSHEKGFGADAFTEHFKGVMKTLGDRSQPVALAVGVPDAFLRHAEVPPMALADMRQVLRLNSKTYLQQDYPDHVFDCAIVLSRRRAAEGANGKPASGTAAAGPAKQKILAGGTKRQTLDELKTACRAAGLAVCQISPGVVGPINAFEVAEPEAFAKEVVALVDIGLKHSTIAVLRSGELIMNRVVTVGGENMTASLAESLGIGCAEAEGIKVGMAAEVRQNLEPAVQALGRELRASIDFFEHQEDVPVGQVLMSGGSAKSEFLVAALQAELMVPCRTWNPTQKLQVALSPQQRASLSSVLPQLTVAIGVAVSAL